MNGWPCSLPIPQGYAPVSTSRKLSLLFIDPAATALSRRKHCASSKRKSRLWYRRRNEGRASHSARMPTNMLPKIKSFVAPLVVMTGRTRALMILFFQRARLDQFAYVQGGCRVSCCVTMNTRLYHHSFTHHLLTSFCLLQPFSYAIPINV